jgi:hypothetical protein
VEGSWNANKATLFKVAEIRIVQRETLHDHGRKKNEKKTANMKDSKIIEVNGIFLGAAIMLRDQAGWQVVAANARVAPADGQIAATFNDASAIVMRAYYGGAAKAA